jgi:molybdate transport system substrate-binding protein
LLDPKITYIATANPDVAPYGKATRQTLKAAGLWKPLQPKLVVAENVANTQQLVVNGQADVGCMPVSLVTPGTDLFFAISSQLHKPIDQALGILTSSKRQDAAQQFVTYLTTGAAAAFSKTTGTASHAHAQAIRIRL